MVVVVLAAPAAANPAGGSYGSAAPVVKDVACVSGCQGGAARSGSTVRLRGKNLADARTITFLGRKGAADDVSVKARRPKAGSVEARVPAKARTGPVKVTNADGAASRASSEALVIDRSAERGAPAGGGPVDARVENRTVYFAGRAKARLEFRLNGSSSRDVRVDLVRAADGATVFTWSLPSVSAGADQAVEWDGVGTDGKLQPEGSYTFVLSLDGAGAASASGEATFRFLRHKFPVRGAHDYGGSEASFGAGRQGHSHEGHDVFAKCGTPLAAARGGVVEFKDRHSAAGHYVVIDGDGTDVDYVYMHLQSAAPVEKGERVFTGQLIGKVGDTGRASGCHLHFEMWSGPGWYEGGSPFDPLPYLKAWDAVS